MSYKNRKVYKLETYRIIMKKNVMLSILGMFLLLSIFSISATVTQNSPIAYYNTTGWTNIFNCSATGITQIANFSIFIDGSRVAYVLNSTADQTAVYLQTPLTVSADGSHAWYCQAREFNNSAYNSTVRLLDTTRTVTDPTDSDIYGTISGAGAGLGLLFSYIGRSIGLLLIPLIFVGIIVIFALPLKNATVNSVKHKK